MRLLPAALFAALPLFSQAPAPQLGSRTFFMQEPRTIGLACADRAKALKPKNPLALVGQGRLLWALGDAQAGEEAFKTASALARGGEPFRMMAYVRLLHRDKPGALKALQQMESLAPGNDSLLSGAALDLLQFGHTEEALQFAEKAWKADPDEAGNWFDFSLALAERGLRAESEHWMERAWKADPKRFTERWSGWPQCLALARAAYRQGWRDLAYVWFERALAGSPKEEHLWMDIAFLLAETLPAQPKQSTALQGDPSLVLGSRAFFQQDPRIVMTACARHAWLLNPSNVRKMGNLAEIQLLTGDEKGASDTLYSVSNVLAVKKDGDVLCHLAQTYLALGRKAEAMKTLADMEKADPRDEGNLAEAALALYKHGHLEEAYAYMEKAWKADKDCEGYCREFANIFLARGDEAKASLWMDRVRQSDPGEYTRDWEKCLALGRSAYRKGMTGLAAKWFEHAAMIKPKEADLWMELATTMAEMLESKSMPAPDQKLITHLGTKGESLPAELHGEIPL